MLKNRSSIIEHDLFFPLIVGLYSVLYILFGEKLPAHGGLGWDGQNYAHIAQYMLDSRALDSYTATRFLPSATVHFLLTILRQPFSNSNIILGFLILNMICLVLTVYLMKRIFVMLKLTINHQLLGMMLFFFSYGICRFLFYYPVMTDSAAVLLSVALLYSHLKRNIILTAIIALLGAITWPVIFYISLFLFLFPFKGIDIHVPEIRKAGILRILSSSVIFALAVYFLYIEKAENEIIYSMKIHRGLLPLSILLLAACYYYLPSILPARSNWLADLKNSIRPLNLLWFFVICIIMYMIIEIMNPNNIRSGYMKPEYLIKTPVVLSALRPFMFLVSHFAFFGVSAIFFIVYWKQLATGLRSLGWGLVFAAGVTIFWLTGSIESRSLFHLFPWMIVFLMLGFRNLMITQNYLLSILIPVVIASKIYLHIGYVDKTGYTEEGTVSFPNQKFLMNQGPWMSSDMYLLHLSGLIIFGALLIYLKRKYHNTANEEELYPQPSGANL